MTRTLDLNALRSFVAIAQTGSVTRAAGALHLTQSAVSMQLKRLEEALGQSLFDRRSKSMLLMPAGEQLLPYARRMLQLNDEIWLRMTDQAYEGELCIGAPHDIVYPHLPEVLRMFAKAYPRVRVTLNSSSTSVLKQHFVDGTLDLILTTEERPSAGAQVLEDTPLVWVGAPNGQAWRRDPLPLAFESDCIFRHMAQEALDAAGLTWVNAVDSMSIRTIEASCSADFAVHAAIESTVPTYLAVIDHGGDLPALPSIKVALYVTDGARARLAQKLAEVVRDVWTSALPKDEVVGQAA